MISGNLCGIKYIIIMGLTMCINDKSKNECSPFLDPCDYLYEYNYISIIPSAYLCLIQFQVCLA